MDKQMLLGHADKLCKQLQAGIITNQEAFTQLLVLVGQLTDCSHDFCPTCGTEMEFDRNEGMYYCQNDWQHG
jgi:NADH pyrophosphatase NudC (nudix superfamily)